MIKPLCISATRNSPLFEFYPHGYLLLKGKAVSANPEREFSKAIRWCKMLESRQAILSIGLDYINNVSLRQLIRLLTELKNNRNLMNVSIIWFIDHFDAELKDTGDIVTNMFPDFEIDLHFSFRDKEPLSVTC